MPGSSAPKVFPGKSPRDIPYGRQLNRQTKILIKRDERRSRLPVDLEPDFDRFRLINFFLKQAPFPAIAAACSLSRGFAQMKYRLALIAGSVPAQPRQDPTGRQLMVHHRRQPQALSVHPLLDALSLAERARKSIADEFSSAL
jgi:hypothetical protein